MVAGHRPDARWRCRHQLKLFNIRRLVAHAQRHDHLMVAINGQLSIEALDLVVIALHQMTVSIPEIPLVLLGWRAVGILR